MTTPMEPDPIKGLGDELIKAGAVAGALTHDPDQVKKAIEDAYPDAVHSAGIELSEEKRDRLIEFCVVKVMEGTGGISIGN